MIFIKKKFDYIFIVMLCMAMQSCISTRIMNEINGHYYKYLFAVREHTARKPDATFANNIFTINFVPNYIHINYFVQNNSNENLQIDWANASLVVHGDSSKIIPQNIDIRYADEIPQPAVILAGKGLQGFVTPTDYIKNTGNGWLATSFYPEHDDTLSVKNDWIMGLIGVDMFKLYLPVIFQGETKVYKFTFYPIEMEKSTVSFLPKQ